MHFVADYNSCPSEGVTSWNEEIGTMTKIVTMGMIGQKQSYEERLAQVLFATISCSRKTKGTVAKYLRKPGRGLKGRRREKVLFSQNLAWKDAWPSE